MDLREDFFNGKKKKKAMGSWYLLWPSLLSSCSEQQELWDVEGSCPFPVSRTQSETCSTSGAWVPCLLSSVPS